MDTVWFNSKYTRDDLDGKTVEVNVKAGDAFYHGVGTLHVSENPEGQLSIDVELLASASHSVVQQVLICVTQDGGERLTAHTDPCIADYLLE